MAVRAKRQLDPKEAAKAKQIEDRVRRARPQPVGAAYFDRCVELARAIGINPSDVVDEFTDRAEARQFSGNTSRDESERLAFLDLLDSYSKQKVAG